MENPYDLFIESFGESRNAFLPGFLPQSDNEKKKSMVYFDYAGTPLASKPYLKNYYEYLMHVPHGNPHSNLFLPSSFSASFPDFQNNSIENCREMILNYYGLSSEEFLVVFTSGTTSSLRMIDDLLPLSSDKEETQDWELWYTPNVHTSVLGLRKDKSFQCLPSDELFPTFYVHEDFSSALYDTYSSSTSSPTSSPSSIIEESLSRSSSSKNILMVLPGEDNFSGSRLDYDILQGFLEKHTNKEGKKLWWVLDAAKLSGSSCMNEKKGEVGEDCCINLSKIFTGEKKKFSPDFITLSFYKIFGYPTGLGALLIKKSNIPHFTKKYFGGGTWLAGSVLSTFQVQKSPFSPSYYEDGSLNFQAISALSFGFKWQKQLGGISKIEQHNKSLFEVLLQKMRDLKHSNGTPLCRIYSNYKKEENSKIFSSQGSVITFNLTYANGSPVPFYEVKKEAESFCYSDDFEEFRGIFLRTGCFCNLGGCQASFGIGDEDSKENFKLGRTCGGGEKRKVEGKDDEKEIEELDVINSRNTGACRISLGYGNTLKDCEVFLLFLGNVFLNKLPPALKLPLLLPSLTESSSKRFAHLISNESNFELLKKLEDPENFFLQKELEYYPLFKQNFIKDFLNESSLSCSSAPSLDHDPIKLHSIYVYPIKSCAGVRVSVWPLQPPSSSSSSPLPTGLLWDRLFAIQEIDERGFVSVATLKKMPHMALLQPSFVSRKCLCSCSAEDIEVDGANISEVDDFYSFSSTSDIESPLCKSCGGGGIFLQLSSVLLDSVLLLPLGRGINGDGFLEEFEQEDSKSYAEKIMMNICGRKTRGVKVSYDADEWINKFMNSSLVANNNSNDKKRYSLIKCSDTSSSSSSSASTEVVKSFANTAQYLLLSLESIQALIGLILSSEKDEEEEMLRQAINVKVESFRPNIIVSGGLLDSSRMKHLPHQEDEWKSLSIPLYQYSISSSSFKDSHLSHLDLTGPCSRCSMVNVNGSSGLMDCRVFEALKEYRKSGSRVYFGQFLELKQIEKKSEEKKIEGKENFLSKLYFLRIGDQLQIHL